MEEDICQGFLRSFNTQLLSISYEPVNFLSTGGKKNREQDRKVLWPSETYIKF